MIQLVYAYIVVLGFLSLLLGTDQSGVIYVETSLYCMAWYYCFGASFTDLCMFIVTDRQNIF
jgi:hypothetical protein